MESQCQWEDLRPVLQEAKCIVDAQQDTRTGLGNHNNGDVDSPMAATRTGPLILPSGTRGRAFGMVNQLGTEEGADSPLEEREGG